MCGVGILLWDILSVIILHCGTEKCSGYMLVEVESVIVWETIFVRATPTSISFIWRSIWKVRVLDEMFFPFWIAAFDTAINDLVTSGKLTISKLGLFLSIIRP